MKHLVLLILLSLLTGCFNQQEETSPQQKRSYKEIIKKGVLRVVTINSPLSYFENRDGEIEGLEYEMVTSFAQTKNLKTEFIVKNSISEILEELKLNKADMAIAGLSITSKRKKEYLFTSAYQKVQQKVICRPNIKPKKIKELEKLKIKIGADTSYEDILEDFQVKYPKLKWEITNEQSTQEIFKELADQTGDFDCTIADSTMTNIYLRYFPLLESSMVLGKPSEVAWLIAPHLKKLKQQASIWIESAKKQGMIASWKDKYYSHFKDFDRYDLQKFLERIKTRLPKYEALFKKYAEIPPPIVDWKLLAAISYQESHWNPKAKSPTGVRGLMMLTRNTAKSVGVKDRTDPEESIRGGAQYIKRLMNNVVSHIEPEDRIWVALASYNVGASHVRDARGLAAWEGENPNTWAGIKAVLPYLSIKKYYRRLPHGYARGLEPVIYIRRIRHYYDLLQRELEN